MSVTTPSIQAIADKFSGIRTFQRDEVGLVGRETELYVMQVAIVRKAHVILHGPPGVAKTMTVDGLMLHLPELSKFKTQAYKASPPEQFLGQVSFKGMEQDKFVRIVTGKLPDVEVAVIDELPRAPRAVLPAAQGMMVEREFDSGNGVQPVPLRSLIGTSNHLPTDPELEAFLDRFGLKLIVKPPQSQDEFVTIMEKAIARTSQGYPAIPDELLVTRDELLALQDAADQVHVPREILIKLGEIWSNLLAESITPSIRRYADAVRIMQGVAVLDGRDECLMDDLQIVQHVLWTHEEQQPTVYRETVKHASEWVKESADLTESFAQILERLGQVQSLVAAGTPTTTRVEIKDKDGDPITGADGQPLSITDHSIKIMNESRDLKDLVARHIDGSEGRDTAELEAMTSQIDGARNWITDRVMGGLEL